MEKVTVTKMFHDPATTKFGPRVRTTIYTEEYPETKMSYLGKEALKIEVGVPVEVTISKNGTFTNFVLGSGAKKWGASAFSVPANDHEERIKRLEAKVFDHDTVVAEKDFDF